MAELAKEIIKDFAMEIADLKRDTKSWQDMYSDLYTKHQDLLVKQKEQEQHLNVGPSYEEMENTLLTEQEQNGNLTKEVERLTAILKERDAEIAKLRLMVPEVKPSEIYTEEPNIPHKVDPASDEDIADIVDPDHYCRDCRHANATGEAVVYCCLLEQENDYNAFACGSFNSKPRKKKLSEE